MVRALVWTTLGAVAFLTPARALAGVDLIVDERPLHAHHLAGVILDYNGVPLPGVRIEVCDWPYTPLHFESIPETRRGPCDGDPKHVIASTESDSNGHFSFPRLGVWRTRYLHLSLNGMNPMEVGVKWAFFAHVGVKIKMVVAT